MLMFVGAGETTSNSLALQRNGPPRFASTSHGDPQRCQTQGGLSTGMVRIDACTERLCLLFSFVPAHA